MVSNSERQRIISSKRSTRDTTIVSAPSYDAAVHSPFTSVTATEIVSRIGNGEWTATQVLEAYIARAALAQSTTNCLTEVLFQDARKRAHELDEEFAITKKLRGPLHGVPMSVKDQFEVDGFDATVGFTSWSNKPSSRDAFLVSQVREAGAIIIAKTNVPQTMFSFECGNPLWGRTTNPWNTKYTCGGSSGGEAALLAMDGSALGLGSDIGGSLRIPAAYCGIYSLKPSVGRMSGYGIKGCRPGFEGVLPTTGPMARSVEDCDLLCRTVFGQLDPTHRVVPVPYRSISELPSKLKFGYYFFDGVAQSSPANVRAVNETVEALQKAGHECVELSTSLPAQLMNTFIALVTADGYKKMLSFLDGDPKEKSLFLSTIGPKLPVFVLNFACWMIRKFFKDDVFAEAFSMTYVKSIHQYFQFIDQRNQLVEAWYKEIWDKHQLDGIIAPVQALPVIPHDACANLSGLASATVLYNVVDSPVGTIPVTRVDPSLDGLSQDFKPGKSGGSPLFEKWMYQNGTQTVYSPTEMKGMPVGVQIVGKKWEDEKVLAMMRVVDEVLGPRRFGPGSCEAQPKA